MFGVSSARRGPDEHSADAVLRYDGAIMMSRTQITLDPEMQRCARQRATDLGVSLAGYLRGLVARDLGQKKTKTDPRSVFDLGSSRGSDISKDKDKMVAEAFLAARPNRRRR